MARLVGALLLCGAVLAPVVRMRGLEALLLDFLPKACLLAGLSYCCHWRKFGKLREIFALLMWTGLATDALSLLVQVVGRIPSHFVDSSLAHLDHLMGASTGDVVTWISHHLLLRQMLATSYQSTPALVLAALILPTTFGYYKDSRLYVLAVTITGVITVGIFALWPALGPWTAYHFAPTKSQQAYVSYLNLLRSSQQLTLNLASSGIVTFPSFHTALAIHSAIALWNIRCVRWFAALLSAAVCASTITTGWHYFTDVLGGAALAIASTAIVRWSTSWLATDELTYADPQPALESKAA
jgi:membrane-associated phospholipid phosphatase